MNFEDFWKKITKDLTNSQEMHTLKQKKSFDASYKSGVIFITPLSRIDRTITKEQFLQVWNIAKTLVKGEQYIPQNYIQITMNSSYILALMKNYLGDEQIQ